MNCTEVQDLIEDAIDRRLAGDVLSAFEQHVAQCAACRVRFESECLEHDRWCRAFNDPSVPPAVLPGGFADRLLESVGHFPPRPTAFGRLPRWAKIAAVLALMASFEAAASWIMSAMRTAEPTLADDFNATYEECTERAFAAELPQGGDQMKTILMLAAGASCIISGSTDRSCSSTCLDESGTFELDSRAATTCESAPEELFDSRGLTVGFGEALKSFRSDKPTGFTVLIR